MDKRTLALLNAGRLRCFICGELILKAKEYSVEHCPPRSRQKELGPSKTYPAHKLCNNDKGSLTLDEYRLFCKLRAIKNGVKQK